MTKIKILGDRIIFDGHADTQRECETITLLCDNLAKSVDFKTIKYESGYAEFEKIGGIKNIKDLMFPPAPSENITIIFDSHITKVVCESVDSPYGTPYGGGEWTTSGQTVNGIYDQNLTYTVTLESGYVIDTVTSSEGTNLTIGADGLTFSGQVTSGNDATITITSKQGGTTKQTIDVSTLSGWESLASGDHSITIKTKASGYLDSASSNAVTINKAAKSYSITTNLVNIVANASNPTTISVSSVNLYFTPAEGYILPDSVTVVGVETYSWHKESGQLFLMSPISNVTVTITGVLDPSGYNVTISDPNNYGLSIYDGTSSSGTWLGTVEGGSKTVVCASGNLYLESNSGAYTADSTAVTGGVTIVNEGTWYYNGTFKVTADGTITVSLQCLIEGTQITLTDGSTKAIEDITYNDELLVWNFYEGKFDKAKPTWIKVEQVASRYNLVKFSNGAEVGFVGMGGDKGYHRIFNKEKGAFTYTGNLKETPNGTTTFAEDNTFPTVVSQEIVNKEVKFYNVITDKHYNLFANGILTSCKLSNKYHIENMKYVGDKLISDKEEVAYFKAKDKLRK